MKEELISFETAKLSEEKGFKLQSNPFGYTTKYYVRSTGTVRSHGRTGRTERKNLIYAPTQSLLQKWLREEHGLFLTVGGGVFKGEIEYQPVMFTNKTVGMVSMVKPYYPTYEEAIEAGLQEALKLIGR